LLKLKYKIPYKFFIFGRLVDFPESKKKIFGGCTDFSDTVQIQVFLTAHFLLVPGGTLPIFCCDSQSHKLTLLQSNTIKVI
jgi:hypothetical protein